MAQYPNEKDPQSDWVSPGQVPPSTQNPPYAPIAPAGSYAASSKHHVPSGEEYLPPQGPPPDYAQTQGHLDVRSGYDQKGPSGGYQGQEVVLSPPPSSNPYSSPYSDPVPAPVPDADPSSSSGHDDGHSGMSLSAFFENKGPPPMWHRQPPAQLPYSSFPPMCLISNNKDLDGGFPELPPPCQLNPHPFATHDVTEEDWKQFLTDIKKAGCLSPLQRIRSGVLPSIMGLGMIGGFFMSNALGERMKYKNRTAAGDLVDHWNHYFFGPRRMEVVLCQASQRLSGKLGVAPAGDPIQERMAHGLRRGFDGFSSDWSREDYNGRYGYGNDDYDRQMRLGGRRGLGRGRGRGGAMWAERFEQREWRARGDDQQPYQLFVTATN